MASPGYILPLLQSTHVGRWERRNMQRSLAKQLGKPASECRVTCDCISCVCQEADRLAR